MATPNHCIPVCFIVPGESREIAAHQLVGRLETAQLTGDEVVDSFFLPNDWRAFPDLANEDPDARIAYLREVSGRDLEPGDEVLDTLPYFAVVEEVEASDQKHIAWGTDNYSDADDIEPDRIYKILRSEEESLHPPALEYQYTHSRDSDGFTR